MDNIENNNKRSKVITEWVYNYSDSLYSWAFYKTSNKETAEDLVQETFLSAFQGIDKFENKSNPKTWLFSILNHKIIDYHRKKFKDIVTNNPEIAMGNDEEFFENYFDENDKWKSSKEPREWDNTGNLLDDRDFLQVFNFCIENLPELWKSAIELKYICNEDGKNICQELGISPSNYWQILHRAKLQLRNCLENNWFKNEL